MKSAVNIPVNSLISISRQLKKGDLNHSSYKWWKERMKKTVKQDDWNDWQLYANRERVETEKTQGYVKS